MKKKLTKGIRRLPNVPAIALIAVGILFWNGPLHAQTSKTLLSQLRFKNSGTVTRNMDFRYFHQPDDYLETPDLWGIYSDGTYFYRVDGGKKQSPPNGMRSAVPLGGLGSGTIELRADGSLRDWNIFNNSPAYGEKIQLDDALFGISIRRGNGKVYVSSLRTDPPRGLPAVQQIEYSGDFPVSRLRFSDPNLGIPVDLYAYSEFRPRDANASATPAAIFTFLLTNPSQQAIHASLFFILPNHIHGHAAVKGGVTFIRDGKLPLSGTIAVRAVGFSIHARATTASDFGTLWKSFAGGKSIDGASLNGEAPRYGAVTTDFILRPGETKTVTYILAWYLPNRPFLTETPGNYYATLYRSADDVADKVSERLVEDWRAMLLWQHAIFDNSLPGWLQDTLMNSVATMYKTGMRFRNGQWRQWESFSCADVDPGHIDFYQSLPYMFFYPDLRKQILSRFAAVQHPDGYIPEELGQGDVEWVGPLDQAGGRDMGDSATVFILGVWQYYLWTGDRGFLNLMWSHVRLAAFWQIERSRNYGLPEHLQTTYDLFHFNRKTLVSYNAFLHLASMRAAEKIAQVQNDGKSVEKFQAAFTAGQHSLDQRLWTGKYYRAWWVGEGAFTDPLLADTLYGQLWASALDLGMLAKRKNMVSHLESETEMNGSPFGLRIMTGIEPKVSSTEDIPAPWKPNQPKPNDNLVWPASSIDWSILKIYLGGNVDQSLEEANKVIFNQRSQLNDQWNYTDLNNNWNGGPWGNSHYTRQLIVWALPLAISGEQWNAAASCLMFNTADATLRRLPFFTPQASGVVEFVAPDKWKIELISGRLTLHEVLISSASWRVDKTLNAGGSILLSSKAATSSIPNVNHVFYRDDSHRTIDCGGYPGSDPEQAEFNTND